MTKLKHPLRVAAAIVVAGVAGMATASVAFADDHRDFHRDHSRHDPHWHPPIVYGAPPVVYAPPAVVYNQGPVYAPPLVGLGVDIRLQ